MVVLLVLVLCVIVAMLAIKPLMTTSWGRRVLLAQPMRARLRRLADRGFVLTPVDEVPIELEATTRILESLGFVSVAVGRQSSRSVVSILLRASGDVIAWASWATRSFPGSPRTGVAMISVVSGRRGVLDTTNSGLDIDSWPWQIVQIFPHASMDVLVRRHEEGRGLLEQRGVRFDQVDAHAAMEVFAWIQSMSVSALMEVSDDVLAKLPSRVAQQEASLAARLDEPDTMEQVERFRTAAPEC